MKQRSDRNLIRKIRWLLIAGIGCLSVYFTLSSYFHHLKIAENGVREKLSAIAATLSTQIDGDAHQYLFEKYREADAITTNEQDSVYARIHQLLLATYEATGLKTGIYTLVKAKGPNEQPHFEFGVASTETPFFRHIYNSPPDGLLHEYERGGSMPAYEDEHGEWISAFAPIRNSRREVVAVVQADYPFGEFKMQANQAFWVNVTISLAVTLLLIFLSNKILQTTVKRENLIVQLRELLDENIQARQAAEAASQAKTQFLATMSHEIRTPMNAVVGLTNLLQKNDPRPDQEENLNTLQFSAENLLKLLNDILDYNKLEGGMIELQRNPFNLKDLCCSILQSQRGRAQQKGIELHCHIDPELPPVLVGDATRLGQVVTNLVDNAVKFTDEGRVSLEAKVQLRQEQAVTVDFAIKDTGAGIPAAQQQWAWRLRKSWWNCWAGKYT